VKGEGFVEIYKWVANHFYEKKNYAEASRMLTIGKEVYPSDPFWSSLELDMTRESGSKEQLFAKYEQVIAAEPSNYLYRYNYAVELYQSGYAVDASKRPANSEELIKKAQESVKQAVRIKTRLCAGSTILPGKFHITAVSTN
jgi:tetratricopeptide (TPR) repeat protein